MPVSETSMEQLANDCAKRAPSALCGDAAAVCCALALSLGGGGEQPRLNTIKFGAAAETDAEPAPRDRCAGLRSRLFELADADEAAERAVLLAIRRPAMLPAERDEKAEKVREALCAACNSTLALMRASGEAVELMRARAVVESDLAKTGISAALALCSGALRALEAEAHSRAARIDNAASARALSRSAATLCERYCAAADETQKTLAAALRAKVGGGEHLL